MKTAIVCDWLVASGGAEKVLGQLIACFPEADLFAVVDFMSQEQRHFLRNKSVTTTFIQKLPFAKYKYRSYLPLMPLAIEQLDLSAYQLVISSSHAVAKGVITGPDQLHISYVHSPMRYAWDLQHHYLRETGLHKKWRGLLARFFLHKLRLWDLRSASGVDHFIANSNFIARRIQKTYRREATVIYPPVDIAQFTPHENKENFYLAASRLVPYKKMDLIVESFKQLPEHQLVVIGDGPDFEKIKRKAGSNVQMLGFQGNENLIYYMQRAKALIFAAEEDFGLVPLEAQACGTPVIAYGKGGALETVRGLNKEKPTGVFFAEQTMEAIVEAINTFEKNPQLFTVENCVANASLFAPERFREKIKEFVAAKHQGSLE
jgi:glycosyltransferase involved in cell wall biosynthesis